MKLKTKKANYTFNATMPSFIFALPTALIGHHIHGSIIWSIFDFIFWPVVWIKWFVYQEVTVTIIKNAFSWFLQ